MVGRDLRERMRTSLEEQRSSLRDQLRDHGVDPDDPTSVEIGLDHGFADSAQVTAERETFLSIVDGMRNNLEEVERALGRIDKGSYGTCERCGAEIAPERLEAIPATRLCIECASGR